MAFQVVCEAFAFVQTLEDKLVEGSAHPILSLFCLFALAKRCTKAVKGKGDIVEGDGVKVEGILERKFSCAFYREVFGLVASRRY